jgi:hypothetical protein
MIDWAFVIVAVSVGLNVLLWTRVKYWHRCYRQLMDDAFERSCRAVLTEQDIVNRAAAHGPKLGYYPPQPHKKP